MFGKNNEILDHLQSTEETLSNIGGVLNNMLQQLHALREQIEHMAAMQTAQPIDKQAIYNEMERERKARARDRKAKEEETTNG